MGVLVGCPGTDGLVVSSSAGGGGAVACTPEDAKSACGADTTCKKHSCDAGLCKTVLAGKGTPCSDGGGLVCSDAGECVKAHCADGVIDADETDQDCGGKDCTMPACANDKKCATAGDCTSGFCDKSGGSGICKPCAKSAQCAADHYCDASDKDAANWKCAPDKPQGASCGDPAECPNDNCVDGVCCDSKCDAPCSACSKALGADVDGFCKAAVVKIQQDAGSCDSAKGCSKPPCGCDTMAICKSMSCTAQIDVGGHSCARLADGTVWCWGGNYNGQLGDGTKTNKSLPVKVDALGSTATSVRASTGSHTCALKNDGTLWCWGFNNRGQLGDGTTVDETMPVQVTALGSLVVEVAVGSQHTCARKTNGTVWCWGWNDGGQLGDGTYDTKSTPAQVAALGSSALEVAAGDSHTCARKADGTLWCWGNGNLGALGDGSATVKPTPVQVAALGTSVIGVTAGGGYTCARKSDSTAWCWGWNDKGQLGDGTTTDKSIPVQLTTLGTTVSEIQAGFKGTCARRTDGSAWCWGANGLGQLGDGTTTEQHTPVQVSMLSAAAELRVGLNGACARKSDNTVWCWGGGGAGQLGNGKSLSVNPFPVQAALYCP